MDTSPLKSDSQRLAGLDGLRAIAVLMVLACHAWPNTFKNSSVSTFIERLGFGVEVFFVISGFLITYLLLAEERKHGAINYRLFYLRRALRIIPPLYVFLAVLGLLTTFGFFQVPWRDFAFSGFFLRNFFGSSIVTGHCWSLAVEEHFYLVWPLALYCCRSLSVRMALCALVALGTPLWSQLVYRAAGGAEFVNSWRTDLRLHGIAVGSLLACLHFSDWGQSITRSRLATSTYTAFIALLVVIVCVFTNMTKIPVVRAFDMLAASIAVGVILNAAVSNPAIWWVHGLEYPVLAAIGKVSYSLYLWQQPFTFSCRSPDSTFLNGVLACVFAISIAGVVYAIIEIPTQKIREKLRRA